MVIPFENEYRKMFYSLEDKIFDSNMWSEGQMLHDFEDEFGEYIQLPSKAIADGGAALLAILSYINVHGKDVIVPANTFWADAQAVKYAGGNVIFADCNKEDLCLSYEDLKKKITPNTKAVILVHIGGHIAFDVNKIVSFCKGKGIELVEDCAHVHGGWWDGKTGGHYGIAGAYSFYATKTMPLGDGGMVVSRNKDLLKYVEEFRNYGKEVINGQVYYKMKDGFNFRLSEFNAALGVIQMKRLNDILDWKRELAAKYDEIFENRIKMPKGMKSGYYKYIVFDTKLTTETGQVFGPRDLGHRISGVDAEVPNSIWITEHHKCVPIYYGWEHAQKSARDLRNLLCGEC